MTELDWSGLTHTEGTLMAPTTSSPDRVTLDQTEAEQFSGLSAKTLERHAKAGEPVGRVKIGRRVLFLKATLQAWLTSKLASPTATRH